MSILCARVVCLQQFGEPLLTEITTKLIVQSAMEVGLVDHFKLYYGVACDNSHKLDLKSMSQRLLKNESHKLSVVQ